LTAIHAKHVALTPRRSPGLVAMRTFALIPAAGHSRRMGRPKLALPLGDRTILEHVVASVRAGGVEDVLVVVGPATAFLQQPAEQAGASVHRLSAETPDMRATVEAGLAWLEAKHHPRPDDAWLLLPADHPTLTSTVPRALIQAAESDPTQSIFVPTHNGQRGHPTLLRWRHAAAMAALPAGQGLNKYIRGHGGETVELPWPSAEVIIDLDTPTDYEELLRRWTGVHERPV
jgi:molybdenum cofactor cytidylyltransferase